MKLARLIVLLGLAWVIFPAHAGAQDKASQSYTVNVGHTVTISWGASTGQTCNSATPPVCTPNNDPISYNVYVGGASGGPYMLLGSTTSLSYVDLDATTGNTYYYVVTAVDLTTDEQSAYSNQAIAIIGMDPIV